MTIDLRLGDWRQALFGVECDAIICDPPYGARTHDSTRPQENIRHDGRSVALTPRYAAWTDADVVEFVSEWSDRCRGWIVALTSHDLIPSWQRAHEMVGRYCFAPVPCVMRGMSVRLAGDGPSSWSVYAMVGRPRTREFSAWGTLDGAYVGPPSREAGGGRGKPDWLMQALVRDYSRHGDTVCDPFAGWGSTLTAAESLGRRAVGSEVDREAYDEAMRRIARPQQRDLFA